MPLSSTDKSSALEDGLDAARAVNDNDEAIDAGLLSEAQWRRFFKNSLDAASEYQSTALRSQWSRNLRAFQSKHPNGTKYDTPKFRNRSKLFKPKTRMAVRKNDATAAAAMFSTMDVVNITAARSSDPVQEMGARFLHAVLNYRLDRGNEAGPPFFLTVVGAHQDAQVQGICVSKQYWEYEQITVEEVKDVPITDEATGLPLPGEDGGPALRKEIVPKTITKADRIMIDNLPPENAFIDPTADWRDPIQRGAYFIAGYPVNEGDLESWIAKEAARPRMGGAQWRSDIDLSKIKSAGRTTQQRDTQAVRRARETSGIDRYESRHASKDNSILWLYEVFYRYDGEDYTWWMLGESIMLSDPTPTRDAYPEQKGDRPYVRGVASVETHKAYPSAPVETWQQLQAEMNENVNLVLDARKMAITPITKVKRGRNIDLKQVQNRGPDATLMVEDEDDVTFDRAPGPDGGAQQDMNNLAVDFDELAGVFSTGSVQTNRQLNETVGGMNLMSQSSNALTEFDLRVWVETWVEPVLRQCVRLIQYFESDQLIMAVAGENAGLTIAGVQPKPSLEDRDPQEQAQTPPITLDEVMASFETLPVTVKVDVGIGALDSKQKVEKLMAGAKSTMEMTPILAADGVRPDAVGIVTELWGLLGYKDVSRFMKKMTAEQQQPKPDPNEVKAKQEAENAKAEHEFRMAEMQAEQKNKAEEHEWKRQDHEMQRRARQQDAIVGQNAKRAEIGLPPIEDGDSERLIQQVMQAQAQTQALIAKMIEALNQPKTVTMPDGRTFTAKPSTLN